jgi:hemoglobin-like flavoprotein
VETSWAKAAALGAETVGVLLFKNIFAIAPGALALFSFRDEPDLYASPKLKAHGATVVQTVGTAVAGLRDLDALVPVLRELGKKHVGYGVLEAHYDVVGDALMKTLEQGLGDAFAPEARRAWEAVYAVVKATMVGDNYR